MTFGGSQSRDRSLLDTNVWFMVLVTLDAELIMHVRAAPGLALPPAACMLTAHL